MNTPRLLALTLCSLLATNVRADSVVVFTEIMYHPVAANSAASEAAEFIELRNQMAVDVDMSGWSLGGGLSFDFPAGTVLTAGSAMVVAANPASFPGALGPWTGKLDNGGESIELRNNNGRAMDAIAYGTDGDWPTAPDGGGASLSKDALNSDSSDATSWRSSRQTGGTPGAENFPTTLPPVTTLRVATGGSWQYLADGSDPGATWKNVGFNDAAWSSGSGTFQLGSDALPSPAVIGTTLPSGPVTYHFRRHFTFPGNPATTTLQLRLLVDDGAAVYLNGVELARVNLPAGAGAAATALIPRRAAPKFQDFAVPAGALQSGDNVLAVEVHQAALLPAYPAAVIASGPVTYWRLGESASPLGDLAELPAAPESGSHNGTFAGFAAANLANAGPRPSDGLTGFEAANTAPNFQGNNDNGDDVALFPDDGTLNFAVGKKFSFEAWVKGNPAQESGGAIIAKGAGGGGEQFACDMVSNTFRFFAWDGGAPNTPFVAQSAVATNNTWQHVVGVCDIAQGIFRLYVNGAQVASATPRPTIVSNTHEVSVGARKNSGTTLYNLNFAGVVDEVALFNRALTPAEITAHYNAAFAASSSGPDLSDAVFDMELSTVETPAVAPLAPLRLNEISLSGVEITNIGAGAAEMSGASLRIVDSAGTTTQPLPAQMLGGGGFLSMPLTLPDGARVVLLAADGATVLDSAVVKLNPRVRFPDGTGPWLRPAAATPGAANSVTLRDEIVLNEIMYDHPSSALLPPGTPRPGQWMELLNKSAAAVDISGWEMTRGISYTFPPGTVVAAGGFIVLAEDPVAFQAVHALPAAQVFGPWGGSLSHGGERLELSDAVGNPADDVTFFSDTPWPAAANAGGSSLELRDPRADNARAGAWAASDESSKAAWQTFTWRAANNPSITGEPTLWRELNLLLVDGPGECLIDDVRVTDTVTSANILANGDFSGGASGWRLLGNHRTSVVGPEPGNPGNSVLRVVASGAGEYQGNQIEATYVSNQALVEGREYEISLRARWLSGGGRLNARLYFDRLPRTHLLSVVAAGGTPGAANSRAVANIGPTYRNLSNAPAMPAANQPVTVSVDAADPDGMTGVEIKYSVNGGAWQTAAMSPGSGQTYSGAIPGQASGTVQFYVEGRDMLNALSHFPARGPQSRALFAVQDGRGDGALRKVRLLLTPADATFLHTPVNTLSNEELGATLIVSDREIYHDIGVRLKGSYVGRNVPRVGFNLLFNEDRLFRGVHGKVAVDRSQHATVGGAGEIIAKHIASAAGGIPNMHDDLAQFVHPSTTYSSVAQLRMEGFENAFLDTQYPNGADGTMFEMEVFRWSPTTVDGSPTSPKLPGGNFLNIDLGNYGADKETYRWFLLQTMNRDRDDYTRAIPFSQMFSLTGAAFEAEAKQRLDYEEFLRVLAYESLVGPADAIFTGTNLHNCRFYFRPHDGRALFMPWDWDSAWQRATNAALIGTGNIAKVVTVTPDATRRYYGHLYDLVQTSYNTAYMTRWTQHYGTVSAQDFSGVLTYIGARATYVLSQLPTGSAFSASAGTPNANGAVVLSGSANIAVVSIEVNGLAYTPTWTSTTAWTITVPLASGPNTLNIRGLTMRGAPVSGATATLNVTNPNGSAWPELRINEWMAENDGAFPDPADGSADDWFEIHNSTAQAVNLAGWKLSDTSANPSLFIVPSGWSIPAGGFLVVWADNEPVQNPGAPTSTSALHVNFKLNNAGETIILTAPDNREVDRVTFGTQRANRTEGRYPDSAGTSAALTASSPGTANVLAQYTLLDFFSATPQITLTATPGWTYQVESCVTLPDWQPMGAAVLATGASITLPISITGTARNYRVRMTR